MLDLKLLRQNPQEIEKKLRTKDPEVSIGPILAVDEELRRSIASSEELQAKRNSLSKEIGERKRTGQDASSLMKEVEVLREEHAVLEEKRKVLEEELHALLSVLPNLPMDEIKVSPDPKDNVCLKTVGQKPEFDFPYKNHLELNEKLQLFDFERGAKITGRGWPVYRGMGARLEWALINYMMDIQIKNGFTPFLPPLLVKPEILYGSGQLPKFKDQAYQLLDEDYPFYLIPTSEVALNGLHFDEILQGAELPKLYTAYTPCFRREAGGAGAQERGLIRVHQFNKVEMFAFTKPEESPAVFDKMVAVAEEILQGLGIHYRLMLLVTGDMSYAAAKTIDVEAYLPGQNRYMEVSSISNCTDFQARRSKIRYRHKEEKPQFVHTLNGSGLATSRLMVSLLECNQTKDGCVDLPPVLHKYLGGIKRLMPIHA